MKSRQWIVAALSAVVAVGAAFFFFDHPASSPPLSPEQIAVLKECHQRQGGAMLLKATKDFQSYQVKVFRDECSDSGKLEIARSGKIVFAERGAQYRIEDDPPLRMGRDVTGDGVSDLVISHWGGGAHCCLRVLVFQLGDKFKKLGEMNYGNTGVVNIVSADASPIVFALADWAFAYFPDSFASSPAPDVDLRYVDGSFRFAMELMRKRPPTENELVMCAGRSKRLSGGQSAGYPAGLWYFITELIYTGNEELAWQFLERGWKKEWDDNHAQLNEFRKRLEGSEYRKQVKALQEFPLDKAKAPAKDWSRLCAEAFR
jgi:hypothetical protein